MPGHGCCGRMPTHVQIECQRSASDSPVLFKEVQARSGGPGVSAKSQQTAKFELNEPHAYAGPCRMSRARGTKAQCRHVLEALEAEVMALRRQLQVLSADAALQAENRQA